MPRCDCQDDASPKPKLLSLTTAEEVQTCISERYPSLGAPITLEAAQQFLDQRPSQAGVVRHLKLCVDVRFDLVIEAMVVGA